MDTNTIANFYEPKRRLGVYHEALRQLGGLQRAVNDTVRALRLLDEAGVDRAWLDETLCGLHDAASNRAHAHARDMDDCGFEPVSIDLTEVDALLLEVRS